MDFTEKEIVAFWDRLKTICKEKGITQIDLCNNLNFTNQTFKNKKVRKVYPTLEEIFKIAEYLNVSVEFLVTGTEKNAYKAKYDSLMNDIQTAIEKNK